MSRREYKSSEKVELSSSEDESPVSPTLIERSPSPSSSVSSTSSGRTSSSLLSSSKSPTRTPTPDPSSYHYIPPSTHELSTSKEKSVLPSLRANEELYLLRIPKGAELRDIQFNFRKRKVRIGEEEWKLVDENTGDTRIIQPIENSEKFEFKTFARGLNVVRDVHIPSINEGVRGETLEKKRKSDTAQVEHGKRRKHQEKDHKHKEDEHKEKDTHKSKDKNHDKEKHRSKEKSKDKENHTRGGKEGKHKSVKHKHKHS